MRLASSINVTLIIHTAQQNLKTALRDMAKVREREGAVYFPQYNKIYVALNDSNKTKWRVATTRPILVGHPLQKILITIINNAVQDA